MSESMMSRRLPLAGIVGNGRTCALIDARARVAWLCAPTFAQFPVFARLLDPRRGGCLEIGVRLNGELFWSGDYGYCAQAYLPGSNVLQTTWALADYRITICDAMPWGENVLLREISLAGSHALPNILLRLYPTHPTPPSTRFQLNQDGISIVETRCPANTNLICAVSAGAVLTRQLEPQQLLLEVKPIQGKVALQIAYGDVSEPLPTLADCRAADEAWLARAVRLALPDRALQDAFDRSLLTLRLLTYEPTGAILAAATASFPSEPGGAHNWDYRYCWVRDGCYTAQALDSAGCHAEAARLYQFLLERESNGQWTSPLWSIIRDYPTAEECVAGMYGPGGEAPIRIGNGAALQDQHDSPGNVLAGVYRHCLTTGATDLAARYWAHLARAVEWCCQHWAEPEAGIWERRDRQRAWVHGRALCWVAVRDGIRLAQKLGKPVPPHWEQTIADISRRVLERGWSEEKGAYLRACETPSIYDISVLALVLENLVPAQDARIQCTVNALTQAMKFGAAFRRDEEDVRYPFYLATLWVIRALNRIGEYARAYEHLRAVLEGATDLGLMAEYFDPTTGRQYGNIPQAYSHEELVKTVVEMLWDYDGENLVMFPAIPPQWLAPGNCIETRNIPLGGKRAAIALDVSERTLTFRAWGTEHCKLVAPSHYARIGWRVQVVQDSDDALTPLDA